MGKAFSEVLIARQYLRLLVFENREISTSIFFILKRQYFQLVISFADSSLNTNAGTLILYFIISNILQ